MHGDAWHDDVNLPGSLSSCLSFMSTAAQSSGANLNLQVINLGYAASMRITNRPAKICVKSVSIEQRS